VARGTEARLVSASSVEWRARLGGEVNERKMSESAGRRPMAAVPLQRQDSGCMYADSSYPIQETPDAAVTSAAGISRIAGEYVAVYLCAQREPFGLEPRVRATQATFRRRRMTEDARMVCRTGNVCQYTKAGAKGGPAPGEREFVGFPRERVGIDL
jgi:hypothetical protein